MTGLTFIQHLSWDYIVVNQLTEEKNIFWKKKSSSPILEVRTPISQALGILETFPSHLVVSIKHSHCSVSPPESTGCSSPRRKVKVASLRKRWVPSYWPHCNDNFWNQRKTYPSSGAKKEFLLEDLSQQLPLPLSPSSGAWNQFQGLPTSKSLPVQTY